MSVQVLNRYQDSALQQIVAGNVMWARLQQMLATDPALQGYHFLLNLNGETLDRTPYDVAVTIRGKTNGRQNIWIDWCGWPMYWWRSYLPPFVEARPYQFTHFVRNVDPVAIPIKNESWLDFYVVGYNTEKAGWYPYDRGLHIWHNLFSDPWKDPGPSRHWGWWVNRRAPFSISDDHRYIFASFALRYWNGLYFYAYANGSVGVDPETYFQFIKKTLLQVAALIGGGGAPGGGGTPPGGGGGGQPPSQPPGTPPPPSTTPPRTQPPPGQPPGKPLAPSNTEQTLLFAGAAALLIGAGVFFLTGNQSETEGG